MSKDVRCNSSYFQRIIDEQNLLMMRAFEQSLTQLFFTDLLADKFHDGMNHLLVHTPPPHVGLFNLYLQFIQDRREIYGEAGIIGFDQIFTGQ